MKTLSGEQIRSNTVEYLKRIDEYNEKSYFQDTWSSLYNYEVPAWYKRDKLGIFFHWGVYTVPESQSEWYSRYMYQEDSRAYNFHLENYGKHHRFGYKELIPLFTGENFDPNEWLELATSLGARYMIPVAEHHDGFQMYESKLSNWNSLKMGPRRDIIASLQQSASETDIKFAVSSHRAEHYWFMDGGLDFNSGIDDPEYGDLYWPTIKEEDLNKDEETTKLFLEDWLVRCCELVDRFKPQVVYFDWWVEMPVFKPYMRKFLAYYYNKSIEYNGNHGVVNYKHDGIPYMVAVRDMERGQFADIQQDYWQCCTSSARNSWSYTKNNQYKSANEIIQTFIDVISKNGNLLLNSGPMKDGSIPTEEKQLFAEIGNWVRDNQEAIFDSLPWKVFGEGDNKTSGGNFSEGSVIKYKKYDIRFTRKNNVIYAFIMNPSGENMFEIRSMAVSKGILTHHAVIKSVNAITTGVTAEAWKRTNNCLQICTNEHQKQLPIVFKIEVE